MEPENEASMYLRGDFMRKMFSKCTSAKEMNAYYNFYLFVSPIIRPRKS